MLLQDGDSIEQYLDRNKYRDSQIRAITRHILNRESKGLPLNERYSLEEVADKLEEELDAFVWVHSDPDDDNDQLRRWFGIMKDELYRAYGEGD